MITLNAKYFGTKKRIVPPYSISLNDMLENRGKPLTLRNLITHIVKLEVKAFQKRQEDILMLRVLTEHEIKEGEKFGKIVIGGREEEQEDSIVDLDETVRIAIQAFEDGLYFVFIGESQVEEINETIHLEDNSEVTFLRLVALSGG